MNLTDDALAIEELRRSVATGDPEKIARTAIANIWPLYSSHFEQLTRVVEALPSSVLEHSPLLRILHRATPVLARSTRPYKPLIYPDAAGTRSADETDLLTMVQMVAFRVSGDVAAAVIYARRLQDRVLRIEGPSRERADGPLWYYHHQIGSTLLAAGDSAGALLEFATAAQLGRLSRQVDAERMALGRTALAQATRGSLGDAQLALLTIERQPAPTAAHISSTTMTERTTRALIGVEKMDPGVEVLLGRLEPYDSVELTWPFALLARARFLLANHRPAEAMEAIQLNSDAHPDQHGSFASDVVNSLTIEALSRQGARGAARLIADSTPRAGTLTKIATIRLALQESRLEFADDAILRLMKDRTLGPGQRAELTLLTAWLEFERTDTLIEDTAHQVARFARRDTMRRLLSSMPLQMIERTSACLSAAESDAFDAAMSGFTHVSAPRRPALTAGELRVLGALPLVTTTAEIASTLHVSPNTIKSQLKSLYRKLGCSTRSEAVKTAYRLHLIPLELE